MDQIKATLGRTVFTVGNINVTVAMLAVAAVVGFLLLRGRR
jgi:hypothetical protein